MAFKRSVIVALFALTVLLRPQPALAFVLDLLGDAAKPLIGPAKEKVEGVLKYVWAQPYGGYADGGGNSGFFFGGRGGLLLFRSLRLGVDYTQEKILDDPNGGLTRMFGLGGGFDIPHTPLQGFATKYINASYNGASGKGWGAGVSFVLVNPFILILERRQLSLNEGPTPEIKQYYAALSFMLL